MSTVAQPVATEAMLTQRERELGAIIDAYNHVTEQLKQSHERLRDEVSRLREELARKNLQLRRRERLAALGEMAAGVAHEIRNPLAGIQLFASLLEKDLRNSPDQLRLAGKIAKGVSSVESIVTDFLEFGRPRDPEPLRMRLEAVIREAVELVSSRAEQAGVRLECGELRDLEIVSDPMLIRQALLNLIINAIDAARPRQPGAGLPEPSVRLSVTRCTADMVVVAVADSGPGVPAELMDRIFNPFFTTKDHGTGLGLAIVHQIAESLGGNVQVANAPQGGAVFSLGLPVNRGSGGQCDRSAGGAPVAARVCSGKSRIDGTED